MQPIGEFLRSYDPSMAKQLTIDLLRQYPDARKHRRWDTKPKEAGAAQQLAPKRAISYLVESASIVVEGSFVNGLAISFGSDIDILVSNKVLRNDLHGFPIYNLQKLVLDSLKSLGSNRTRFPIKEGVRAFVGNDYFSDKSAREEGYLNTVSFEIFPDRVDLLIYDPAMSLSGYPTFEIFRTE